MLLLRYPQLRLDDYWKRKARDANYVIESASGHPIEIMPLYHEIRINTNIVVLNHYPMRSWKASFYNSWHLYGHVHKVIEPWGMSMNVGVDINDGCPFSEQEVVLYMENRLRELESRKEAG